MGALVKILLVGLLTLPALAFVTGALISNRPALEPERAPVVLDDPVAVAPEETIVSRPREPRGGTRGNSEDPGEVEVIAPRTTELDDDREDDAREEREERDEAEGRDREDDDHEPADDRDDHRDGDRRGSDSDEEPEGDHEADDRSGADGGDGGERSDEESDDESDDD